MYRRTRHVAAGLQQALEDNFISTSAILWNGLGSCGFDAHRENLWAVCWLDIARQSAQL